MMQLFTISIIAPQINPNGGGIDCARTFFRRLFLHEGSFRDRHIRHALSENKFKKAPHYQG